MATTRLYCSPIIKGRTELSRSEAHHAVKVKRLTVGQEVELFDGKGSLAVASIVSIGRTKVTVEVSSVEVIGRRDRRRIIVASSVPKGQRFDWLIGKCTELGVDRISPLLFERTVKQPKNQKVVERCEKLAVSAAKQCRRRHLPQIDAPRDVREVLEQLRVDYSNALLLVGSCDRGAVPLADVQLGEGDVIAVIGPEGGITEREDDILRQFSAKQVRLTDTILRVETAAVAFAAILSAQRDAVV